MAYGELVAFKSKDIELDGFLAKGNRKSPVLLIDIHGMAGNFHAGDRVKEFFELAPKKGFDVLSIETRGSELYKKFYGKKKKLLGGTGIEKVEECVHDIGGAVRFAKKRGYKKIVLVGHSTGCQKAIYYQAKKKNPAVKALVLLAPGDDYNLAKKKLGKKFEYAVKKAKRLKGKKWFEQIFPEAGSYTAKRFLSFADPSKTESKLFNYEGLLSHFSKIKKPVLIVFGKNDEHLTRPLEEYEKILESRTNSKKFDFKTIHGADHCFRGKGKETAKTVLEWLSDIL